VTDERPQRKTDERFARYRDTGDPRLRDEIIEDHLWIASHIARRFMDRGEPLDDLIQVARLGLVKAMDRFDPDHGATFPAYAMPSVLGEVRRHFRDATWSLKVTRRAKELSLEVTKVTNELSHELGRSPRTDEIATRLEVSEDLVLEALDASAAYRALPLAASGSGGDTDDGGPSAEDGPVLGFEDLQLTSTPERVALHAALAKLPARERKIVELRFYEGLTQSEIAAQVGTSQVHVSRLLRSSLARLQSALS
jgi:RNA polymerase sigma-B factor